MESPRSDNRLPLAAAPNLATRDAGGPAVRRPSIWLTVVFVWLALTLVAGAARQGLPTGEELYVDRLGCWNCHGAAGEGGGAAGPALAKTQLPFRRFLTQTRLPSGTMPPVAPILASDAELAIVYRWLDGAETVKIPFPVSVVLKTSGRQSPSPAGTQPVEVELTVARSEAKTDAGGGQVTTLRVSVHATMGSPVAGQPFEYQAPGQSAWSTLMTNEEGEALLPDDVKSVSAGPRRAKTAPIGRLRFVLQGKHALVVEALDQREPGSPAVIGVGSAVLTFP